MATISLITKTCICTGFIDYIVSPIFDVCGDMLQLLTSELHCPTYNRPWLGNLVYNRQRWLNPENQIEDSSSGKLIRAQYCTL